MRTFRIVLSLALLLGGVVIAPNTAVAVDPQPPTTPSVIKSTDFNTGAFPTWMTRRKNPQPPYGVAATYLWGFESKSRVGTSGYGLWCAAYDTQISGYSYQYPTYPFDTAGQVIVKIPELADYYSSTLEYSYLMPSIGALDGSAFNMQWGPMDTAPSSLTWSTPIRYNVVSSWTGMSHSLNAKGLSRAAGEIWIEFNNRDDGSASPAQGQGATIDNLYLKGYKYGPVRSLTASGTAAGVQLSWLRPVRALGSSTAEERTLSYRVWRRPQTAPTDPWTELTLGARLTDSATTFFDGTAAAGTYYDYLVVPYGTGTDLNFYGSSTQVLGMRPSAPAAPVMTSLTSSSHPAGVWGSASSVALAWSATGTSLTGYGLVFDQNAATTVNTQTTTGTSGTGTATSSGTWYAHVAAKDSLNQWSTTRHLQVLVDMTKPTASDNVVAAGYEGTASVTLSATDAHSGVKAIDYQIDAGAPVHTTGSSASFQITTPGTYTLSYTAEDNAGNVSTLKQATVTVTAVPPPAAPVMTSLSSSSHPAGVWGSASSVALAWSATGTSLTGYGLVFDQNAATTVNTQTTTGTSGTGTATSSGTWYAHVAAKDSLNQWSSTRHLQVLVDMTKPTASDNVVAAGYEGTASVTLSATDAHSGVKAIDYQIDAGAPVHTTGSSASFQITTPGTYTLSYTAEDNAGNVSTLKQATVTVTAVPPPAKGISVALMASRLEIAASQTTTFTYTITNTGDVDITGIALTNEGQSVATGFSTLAAGQTKTVTGTYVGAADAGFVVFDAAVSGMAGATPVSGTSQLGVQVHTPKVSVAVSPTTRGVSAGKLASFRVNVTNTGDVALDLGGTIKLGGGTGTLSAASVAPGATAMLSGAVASVGAVGSTTAATANISATCGSGTDWERTITGSSAGSATVVKDRLSGATRTATAVELSKAAFPSGATSVVIATANGYADALSASALAASKGGPLLLVQKDSVPSEVVNELARLGAKTAYVIGGTGVVSEKAAAQLATHGLTVSRVAGASRYETAAEVSAEVDKDPTASKTVFLATGTNFPDALAASSLAAAMKAPIMLTRPTDLPAETLAALKSYAPTRVVIVGGTGAVDDAIQSSVRTGLGLSSSMTPRIAGASRYDTAKRIIDWGRDTAGLAPDDIDGMYLASGINYPDALAGGVFAAASLGRWRPLMLTDPRAAAPVPEVRSLVSENPLMGYVTAIGGTSAMPQGIYSTALGYVP